MKTNRANLGYTLLAFRVDVRLPSTAPFPIEDRILSRLYPLRATYFKVSLAHYGIRLPPGAGLLLKADAATRPAAG